MPAPQSTLDFAHAARQLSREARRLGLVSPSFRCPPRVVGADRTLRRHPRGAVVAVRLKDRPWMAVLGDMIEGVVVANALHPPHADRVRTQLWAVVGGQQAQPSAVPQRPVGARRSTVTSLPDRRVA